MASALLSIQVLPTAPHQEKNSISYIEQAIDILASSGLPYRVGPLETTIEGETEELLSLVQQIQQKLAQAGCPQVMMQMKLFYSQDGITISELTQKYD